MQRYEEMSGSRIGGICNRVIYSILKWGGGVKGGRGLRIRAGRIIKGVGGVLIDGSEPDLYISRLLRQV